MLFLWNEVSLHKILGLSLLACLGIKNLIGDGATTYLWRDNWHPLGPLIQTRLLNDRAERLLALISSSFGTMLLTIQPLNLNLYQEGGTLLGGLFNSSGRFSIRILLEARGIIVPWHKPVTRGYFLIVLREEQEVS